jgi:elongation factor G
MTMKSVDLPHLRSVVLAGHAGSGKTTLAEQLLFRAGAIPRLGRVDDGTAHLDFEPEEQKRRESLSLAVGTFESDGTRISLVDTPGYPDFIADVIEGFAATGSVQGEVRDACAHGEACVHVGRQLVEDPPRQAVLDHLQPNVFLLQIAAELISGDRVHANDADHTGAILALVAILVFLRYQIFDWFAHDYSPFN